MHKHLTTQSDQDRERYPPENMSTTAGQTKGVTQLQRLKWQPIFSETEWHQPFDFQTKIWKPVCPCKR